MTVVTLNYDRRFFLAILSFIVYPVLLSASCRPIWTCSAPSMEANASGFAIGARSVFSLAWSIAFRDSPTDSSLQMIRNVPHLELIPAKLFLIVLGVFFPIYLNTTTHGARSVEPRLVEMGRSYGLSRLELILKIIPPGALPSILVGVRYALGIT
jgi:sulfonate transport system permease protein